MNASRLYLNAVVFLICLSPNLYSQTDSAKIFYTKDCSILYISGFEEIFDEEKKINKKNPVKTTIDSIKKLSFLSDSIVEVSRTNNEKLQLNLSGINKIKFYKGLNAWNAMAKGAVVGAGAGILLGLILAGWTYDSASGDQSAFWTYPLFFTPITAIIGFVWGAFHPSAEYYKYSLSKIKANKKGELIRILNLHSLNKTGSTLRKH